MAEEPEITFIQTSATEMIRSLADFGHFTKQEENMNTFTYNYPVKIYENVGLTPGVIANAVLYAVSQPDNVAVPDLVVCPSMEG